MSSFGRIISPSEVEGWVRTLADSTFTEYIAEVERQRDFEERHYPELRSIMGANDFMHWPEDQVPALVVMNFGLAEPPAKRSGGVDVTWAMGAAIVVSTPTRSSTREAMNDYGIAFAAMIVQNSDLNREEVMGTQWIDARPAPLPDEAERTLGAQQMFFNVQVRQVVDPKGSFPFSDPREDPYGEPAPEGPFVQSGKATFEIIKKEGEL